MRRTLEGILRDNDAVDQDTVGRTLDAVTRPEACRVAAIDGDLLAELVRKAKGAAGPDRWSSTELRVLPRAVADAFALQILFWMRAQALPKVLKQWGQIGLPKVHKLREDGYSEHDDVRPLSITSVR